MKLGQVDKYYHGPQQHGATHASPTPSKAAPGPVNKTLPPSAEPARMKMARYVLDNSFVAHQPAAPAGSSAATSVPADAVALPTGATPLSFSGSDGRFDVQLPRGAVDLTEAKVDAKTAPSGTPTLQISQINGHSEGENNILGSYQVQVIDGLSKAVQGVKLVHPMTIRYHYTPQELTAFELDPEQIFLTWPDMIKAARAANQPTDPYIVRMTNDAKTHTLSAQVSSVVLSPMDVSGSQDILPYPKPILASVAGNTGGLNYSYPLSVAQGPGGFGPQLALSYSSQSVNDRHNPRTTANSVGDGWSLGFGSVSVEHYPTSGAGGSADWYTLGGVAGVSDRLIPGRTSGFYNTEHMSHLRIQLVSNGTWNCFHVWDKGGTYYELGCTADSAQYTTDSTGAKQYYRWDVNKIVAPFDNLDHFRMTFATYLQDITDSGKTVRDAALKQIVYGYTTSQTAQVSNLNPVAGAVDFHYIAPTAQGSWADAYGTNEGSAGSTILNTCTLPSGYSTTLRCDDPITYNGGSTPVQPAKVMSTYSLASVTSYVGDDSASSHKAFGYTFQYFDGFNSVPCYDQVTQLTQFCAGSHWLTYIHPIIYQNGTAYTRKPMQMGYEADTNSYYDASQNYGTTVSWGYLDAYVDQETGVGQHISYGIAYNNTNGTPYTADAQNNIVDDRLDPAYCHNHANDPLSSTRCEGIFAHPDNKAWSVQVVTRMWSWGSEGNGLPQSSTSYQYQLATTVAGCNPLNPPTGNNNAPQEGDCVGFNYIPNNHGVTPWVPDTDWQDYYHSEFRGFNKVFTTSSSGNLTVGYYYSTEGWNTPSSDGLNYNSGQLYQQDVYQGTVSNFYVLNDSALLQRTTSAYTSFNNTINSCDGLLSAVYSTCVVLALNARTTWYEGTGSNNGSAPWVQHDYTYDDYNTTQGFLAGNNYHNLLKEVVTSSNAPTLTKKWSYSPTDVTMGGWPYYNVNKAVHGELDDASGHVWNCEDFTYDEGNPIQGIIVAGLLTTHTQHTDCTNQANTTLKSYTGYDQYGNVVETVDPFGAANSGVYSGKGCNLSTAPVTRANAWPNGPFTSCTTYDSARGSLPITETNALGQSTSTAYDATQGNVPIGSTSVNGQTTNTSYIYDTNGNEVVKVTLPGAAGSYSKQSTERSSCTFSTTLPCDEIDTTSALYPGAMVINYYDSLGREVESRTTLDSSHDLMTITTYNDNNNTVFKSQPFRVSYGSWVDPANAKDENGNSPAGTISFTDALGRTKAVQDPIVGSSAEPGISCGNLSGVWSSCTNFGLGSAKDDSAIYTYAAHIDANSHMTVNFNDSLGRERYTQEYSSNASISSNITTKSETQYNVLDKPTAVIVTDEVPQSGQTITSVTTSVTYNDMGWLMSLTDPDRGTITYSYDSDGRMIQDTNGTRTVGTSYDLLGRTVCVQDAAPTTDGSGNCSSGSHPLVQDTYDTSKLGVSGSSDFPVGQLNQTVATTYYPDGTSATVTEQFQHDNRGRAVTHTLQIGLPSSWNVTTALPTYQATQTYNDDDQSMTTQTTVNGQPGYTFSQAYDSTTGTLIGMSNNSVGGATLAAQSYDLHGQVSDVNFQATDGTGQIANDHFTFDGDLRPASTTATWQSGSGTSGTIYSGSRSFDPVGNVNSITTTQAVVSGQSNSGGNQTENFCYDELNRLVWSGNSGTQPANGTNISCGTATLANTLSGANYSNGYAYTHLGQLWQGPLNGYNSYQYLYCDSTHPHQLTGLYPIGTTCANKGSATASYSVGYDAWGNVTSRNYGSNSATLSYDVQDHLTQYDAGTSGKELYVYDSKGERVVQKSTVSGGTPLVVYAFGSEEHAYQASGNSLSDTYYYTLGGRLIGILSGTNTSYLLTDALGSVVSRFTSTTNSGTVLGNGTYLPYGSQHYAKGSTTTKKGYTGQYHDATGLDYYNARYYDPVVGRFLSVDSVEGNMQGADPYTYVSGNPETMNDPTGQRQCMDCGDDGKWSYSSDQPPSSAPSYANFPPIPYYPPVKYPAKPQPKSAPRTPVRHAAPAQSSNFWGDFWHGAGQVAAAVGEATLGTTSMVHDVQTLVDSKGSVWDKALAAGDLALNVGMDISMVTGVGETARGLFLLGKIGGELAEHEAAEMVERQLAEKAEQCVGLSFSSATVVATAAGEQAIGTMQKGERVWAYNPKTQKMELQPVLNVWINHDNDLVDLTLVSTVPGKKGQSSQQSYETIHTNKKHPFLTKEYGFITVADLHVGMHVVQANGSAGEIVAWKVVPGSSVMYNLEVAQDHTFTVGDGQWVVHNCNEFKGWIKHSAYNAARNELGKNGVDKFVNAMQKGFVAAEKENGVKRLTKEFFNKHGYQYEIKVLGKLGDYRIYGNFDRETGFYIFDNFSKHLK